MIKNLEKWMYVNNIENKKLLELGVIIEKENIEPVVFTKKGEILYYFWKLVNNKIKLEEFYLFNDIYFPDNKIYKYRLNNGKDALDYIKINYKKNKLYILDSLFEENIDMENLYFV